jgi:predicted dehydrogenase
MDKVRLGIVGVGVIGNSHARKMPHIQEVEFTAVADIDPEAADLASEEYSVRAFGSSTELIESGLVDAVLIATPHYDHPTIAIEAMRAGLHVYAEKPMAVRLSSADEMIAVAKETGMCLQVGFNSRATSFMHAARRVVEEGRLGEIYRTELIDCSFRSQAYYDSATWRATWKGEGGGVLMNQSPHGLDRFVMLAGLPSRVHARVMTRRHRIEVEDEASAILEYANGATGYVHCSVNDAPGGSRLEILGEKGKLVLARRGIRLYEIPAGVQAFSDTTGEKYKGPEVNEIEVEIPELPKYSHESHADMVANFARAIMEGEPLLCPGEEGIRGLELADAILLSGNTSQPVDVPVDRAAFDAWLAGKRGE